MCVNFLLLYFTKYLLANGVDVARAMRHFRHTSLEMFQRYVKRLGVVNEKIRDLKVELP